MPILYLQKCVAGQLHLLSIFHIIPSTIGTVDKQMEQLQLIQESLESKTKEPF